MTLEGGEFASVICPTPFSPTGPGGGGGYEVSERAVHVFPRFFAGGVGFE